MHVKANRDARRNVKEVFSFRIAMYIVFQGKKKKHKKKIFQDLPTCFSLPEALTFDAVSLRHYGFSKLVSPFPRDLSD